jgi:hypothetical protein
MTKIIKAFVWLLYVRVRSREFGSCLSHRVQDTCTTKRSLLGMTAQILVLPVSRLFEAFQLFVAMRSLDLPSSKDG